MTGRAPVGNAGAALAGLLAGLGVADTRTRATVQGSVEEFLAEKGMRAQVVGLRYGMLTVAAEPAEAHLLGFERDNLLARLEQDTPGQVSGLRIRSRAA